MEAVAEKPQKKVKKKTKTAQSNPFENAPSSTQNSSELSKHSEPTETDQIENPIDCNDVQNITNNEVEPKNDIEEPNKHDATVDQPIAPPPTMEQAATNSAKVEPNASSFEKFLDMNKQILYTLDNIDAIPIQSATISSHKLVETTEEYVEDVTIRPYTEQQLNALYNNSELAVLEEFSKAYINGELGCLPLKNHRLYELLSSYLKARERLTGINLEIQQLRNEYGKLQQELWTVDTTTVRGSAACQDGHVVSTSQEFNRSIFHRSVLQNISRVLSNLQKLIYDKHVLLSYMAEDLRLQIEFYVGRVTGDLINAADLNERSPVALVMEVGPNWLLPFMSEIRLSISVLFAFQRKLIKDKQFLDDTRAWLTQLVAVLIRAAHYEDHLFIIHHILRCPAGVSTWASSFIQVPLDMPMVSPFANYQINHLLCILSIITSPVKERREFLKDIIHCDNLSSSEANWVVVDSDGEEDEETGISLRENDLVAMLNQLPLGDMFRCILLINRIDGKDQYNVQYVQEQHVIRFFAFISVLLKLFNRGLQTYCQPKYNQFSKRLSRFIRHIVQYATDQWELFLKGGNILDKAMLQRLQAEYDAVFLRAIYYLYSSQKVLAWQFLAVVPYNMVTIKTLWKIYYFLHLPDENAEDIVNFSVGGDFRKLIWEKEVRSRFEEKLFILGDAEVYYLLNTFSNMALARSEIDMDFIYSATMDILQVGFVSQITQDTSAKSARILLAHITSKHPILLSNILKTVQEHIDEISSFSLFLYEDLPLSIWVLTNEDLKILQKLLLNYPVDSDQTKLARMILARLNWDLLPYEMHCATALLVLKAVDQESVYLKWGWQTILRLKLHISDSHFNELGRVLEPERCDILLKGIREQQPLACFVSILMTTWGHLVPLICSNGLDQLISLQAYQKHEAVLFALYQVVPIFITCQECIINCDKFQQILLNLLNADRGYISYAKSFIVTQNTVLQQFGNMVETQIANYACYGLQSPRLLVRLWMNSLVSIPNWNKDNAILYLLNVIIRTAFFYRDSIQIIFENFRDLYQSATPQESPSIISMFKWASGNNNAAYSLLPNSLSEYPWLAYIFFEVEHQEKEVRTGLWMELLKELCRQKGKINVDNAIKNATGNVKIPSFSSDYLCIYRYAQQALDMPMDHALLPLIWQKFFILFLTRLPDARLIGKTCIGERFFDGIVNFAFLKRMKRKLQETIDFYKSEIEANSEEPAKLEHCKLRYDIFQAFLLWLEEPRLHAGNLLLQSLPTQYLSKLLSLIIQENNQIPWYEYIDRAKVVEDQSVSIKLWKIANFREKTKVNQPLPNPGKGVESADPVERILRRLETYDFTKPPPTLKRDNLAIPNINLDNTEAMLESLKPYFTDIHQFAHNHNLTVSEHKSLNCRYQELIPQLFCSVLKRIKRKVPCKGKNQTVLCSGPAQIVLEVQEVKRNERVDHELQTNRQSYESLMEKTLQPLPIRLHTASVVIQRCVLQLQEEIRTSPQTAELGVELFYHILSFFQEETIAYLPAKSLFVNCIEKLGQSHICGVEYEMPRLLELVLKEPHLGGYLAPYFLPSNCGNSNILLMYSTITTDMATKNDVIFALTSKFEIDKWLNTKSPNLSQRSTFIGNVIEALTRLGYDPAIDALTLHGLYRKHLLSIFEFQFPEHYGEILLCLLKASNGTPDSSLIAPSVWIDILNSLANPAKINLKAPLREQLRQFAQHNTRLTHHELLETADLLAKYFTQERLSYGLYGLYPKCRKYIDIFALLLGMIGHGIIVSTLNTHQGLLGDRLCEKIWPYLREMFAPWLITYSMQTFKDNMATWIQQLADDRSILLPWIPSDRELAEKIIKTFCECVSFILDTLPASSIILSYLWQWYVTSFCHASVKDHVLIPIHQLFSSLPWTNFWPSLVDMEYMLKVIDQYLPECHSFLGYIFISVPWAKWISSYATAPAQIRSRVVHCFLSLLVKLSIEPNIRRNHFEQARSILIQAESFDWHELDPTVFQHIVDWVVMSCDSAVIFKTDVLDLDYRLLCLLKLVSGYDKVAPPMTANLLNKRRTFVKAHTKLLSIYVNRHKNVQNLKQNEISRVIDGYLNDLDILVSTSEEMENLLKEIVSIINVSDISEIVSKVLVKWVENKGYGLVAKAMLRSLGTSVIDYRYLAGLYEATLTSYFNNNLMENNIDEPSWKEAAELINISVSKPLELEQVLIEEGSVLTLNAILLQRLRRNADIQGLLNCCIEWLDKFKVSESLEPKIPLIWFVIVKLALQLCTKDEASTGTLLNRFAHILLQLSEDDKLNKWGRGLLTAIGLSKSETFSIKFMCRAMAGFILAQLPEMKLLPQKVRSVTNAPSAVGMPGGNVECSKVLLELDFRQSQGKIRDCAVVALTEIQDPTNSLHNASAFLWILLKHFYIKPYLKDTN